MSELPQSEDEKNYEKYISALDESPASAEQAKETLDKLEKLYLVVSHLLHEAELCCEYNLRSPKEEDLSRVLKFDGEKKRTLKMKEELKKKWNI